MPVTSTNVANILAALTNHLQQQNTTFTQELAEQLQQQRDAHMQREVRIEGISMPTFSGLPEEYVDEFVFRAKLFMRGKNIDYHLAANQHRVVAMLAANVRAGAASW
ncbi:hypothetical protein PHYSODRAFT_480453 [Phytophthora sojae]|uniref:Uncharacterized protein n=1 Tax=Phytophthora sojae (strain P6497) TaxID=1094619 RepID=G4Z1H7_PHYSP|nr:hypothetical protein PHYSODRAFT_480453 [Phytophthora sojae]EGZ25888.1 hypothetical protein PHYSODRAFT_480453 [Phytophthora sojae]|eukprot:XP_009521176.1 hypothetical protein PHYSODRAFT_480453 [Phytophthora sojae]